MKKLWIIGTLAALAVIAFGVVGYAYAQSQDADDTDGISSGCGMSGAGRGMMRMFGSDQDEGGCGFANGAEAGEYGPLHDYMYTAFAQALGLTPEELETRRQAGDTLWDIAQEQGLTAEQFQAMMTTARTSAINQAVADGVITQAQADWMLERMNQMQGYGVGDGSCPGGGMHGRGRWNSQPVEPQG
jgi:hypothetical protein